MVRHVFLWKVAPGSDPDEVVAILNELPDRVPGALTWSIGAHQGAPGASGDVWEYGLVCDFESYETLKRYSEHPAHLEIIDRLLPMFEARAVCDFEIDVESSLLKDS